VQHALRVRACAHGPDSQIPENRTIAWEKRRRAQLCQLDISRVTRRSNGGVSECVCCWQHLCPTTARHSPGTTVCSVRSTDNTQCVCRRASVPSLCETLTTTTCAILTISITTADHCAKHSPLIAAACHSTDNTQFVLKHFCPISVRNTQPHHFETLASHH